MPQLLQTLSVPLFCFLTQLTSNIYCDIIAEIFESGGTYIRYDSVQKLASYFFPIASDIVPGLTVSNVCTPPLL